MRNTALPVEFDIMRTTTLFTEPRIVERETKHLITIEVIRDIESFSSLHDQWNSVAEGSSATIFQTHEWQYLWWKHFGRGDNRTLHILIVRDNQTMIGIIPLFLEVQTIFGFQLYKRLRLLGCGVGDTNSYSTISEFGPSDFLDFIALPKFQSLVAEAFTDYLKDHPIVCDEIRFENVSDESIIKGKLFPRMEFIGADYEIHRSDICPRLKTPSSVGDYLRGLHSSVRRRLVQAQKAFSRESVYTLETISPEMTSVAFDDLAALHQVRWNRLGYPGLFHDIRFRHFQEDVLCAFGKRGWIWFKALRKDNVRIAARLGFTFNGRLYDYLSGFDDRPSLSKLRPGFALLLAMVEDAIESTCQCVELLRGKEQYKFELTSNFTYNWNIRFYNLNTPHAFRSSLYRIVRRFENMIFQLSRERLLFLVQYHEHGLPSGVFHYVAFRIMKLTEKITDGIKNYRQSSKGFSQQPIISGRKS